VLMSFVEVVWTRWVRLAIALGSVAEAALARRAVARRAFALRTLARRAAALRAFARRAAARRALARLAAVRADVSGAAEPVLAVPLVAPVGVTGDTDGAAGLPVDGAGELVGAE
jgi:hypothetical protein